MYRRVLTHHAHEDSHWQHDSNTYKKCLKCFRKYFEIWQVHVFQNRRWATFMKHVWHWRGWYFQINLADQVSRENGIFCLKMCFKRNILWKVLFVNWDCVQDDLEWVSLQRLVEEWSQAEPWRRSRRRVRLSWRSSTTSAACLDVSSYTVIFTFYFLLLRRRKIVWNPWNKNKKK